MESLTGYDVTKSDGGHGNEAKVETVHKAPSFPEGQHP